MAKFKKLRKKNMKLMLEIDNLKLKKSVLMLKAGNSVPKEYEVKGFRN